MAWRFIGGRRASRDGAAGTARRAVPAGPGAGPATGGAPPDPARSGTASSLHAFNRFELKYLVPVTQLAPLRAELQLAMDGDAHSGAGGYPVESIYYDTAGLRFYWEKLEGLRFRRKLRLRRYGDATDLHDGTTVFVEIKQRVNRVTQKRRLALPYADALRLCAGHGFAPSEPLHRRDQAFVEEVTSLVGTLRLRPTVTTGYHREAYLGRDADLGLRVTVDHRLRGRDRDFHLPATAASRFTLPPHLSVLEVKANERVPTWVTDLTARMDLQVVRISKYCQSVEAFRLAPRSVMHRAEEVDELMDTPVVDQPGPDPSPAGDPVGRGSLADVPLA